MGHVAVGCVWNGLVDVVFTPECGKCATQFYSC